MSVAIGASSPARLEGHEKVMGEARYAYEHRVEGVAYAAVVQSPVAKGRLVAVDATAALALPGVLAVLSVEKAPRLDQQTGELAVFQHRTVAYRGQILACVVAESLEAARRGAELVGLEIDPAAHDVVLTPGHPKLYTPDTVTPNLQTDTQQGDIEAGLAAADIVVDETYTTPPVHNLAMEPHATLALWTADRLTVYDSNQGASRVQETLAVVLGIDPALIRVISPHVGGGFGSKGSPRPHVVVAVLAAQLTGRPVKLALTRQEMFSSTGYRSPTIQRVQLGASRDGRLTAIAHDALSQTSTVAEFAEKTAVATRVMYAAPNRRTTHRIAGLDVPTPSFMRAPGICPGMYALETAIDELAIACGIDPIELRLRNEPALDPETGLPFSSRSLVECLTEGARRFGWADRAPLPRAHPDGDWLIGTGVASSTYTAKRLPSRAAARLDADGTFVVEIAASDVGNGARTIVTQVAAETLGVPLEAVRVEIGDSALPAAPIAAGSMGTASWGSAVSAACTALREQLDLGVAEPRVEIDTAASVASDPPYARHAFGAQFAEVRVNVRTGEIRVSRLLGVFAAGRILNERTARSQLVGGMVMGLAMTLFEESIIDREFGDYGNHDFASYHVATHADVESVEAICLEEHDPHVNPIGVKGVGEIGIVGTAAAIGNAVHHATGIRFRDLPLRVDRVLPALAR
jgi:xanthine dehydrogenase YagR molybdenum-binding subunit